MLVPMYDVTIHAPKIWTVLLFEDGVSLFCFILLRLSLGRCTEPTAATFWCLQYRRLTGACLESIEDPDMLCFFSVLSISRPMTAPHRTRKGSSWNTQELCKRTPCRGANGSCRKARRSENSEKMQAISTAKKHQRRCGQTHTAHQQHKKRKTIARSNKSCKENDHWELHSSVSSSSSS